jgi:hypothetical protein
MAALRKIHLVGGFRYAEMKANDDSGSVVLKPGMLGELDSDGRVKAHSSQGGAAEKMFVQENALAGGLVTTEVTMGKAEANTEVCDPVPVCFEYPGSITQALLNSGVSYAIGDKLTSNGDGTLCKTTSVDSLVTDPLVLAVVVEALDLSAGGAVDSLGKVRVL